MKEIFTAEQKKIIFLSSLGGALENYDFVIFIFFAKIIGELFFPKFDPVAALMAALSIFAMGYLARPLGGILFGHLGDKYGRKKTFVATVFLMAIPTFLIGCLPTYKSLGIYAAIFLVILRLIQGISLGGEIPGAIVFISESVPSKKRGLATAVIFFGINVGLLSGSFFSALLSTFLTHEQLIRWGWRVPFILGGLFGILSYYMRTQLKETPIFKSLSAHHSIAKLPFSEVITHHPLQLLRVMALAALHAGFISLSILYFPTYLSTFFNFPMSKLLVLNTWSILIFTIPILLTGHLSDLYGRKKIILFGILFFMLFSYPLYTLFYFQSFALVIFVSFVTAIFGAFVVGVFPCMSAELFPTDIRYTGIGLSYNFGLGIIAGIAPLLSTALIKWSGNLVATSWVLSAIAFFAFIAWIFTPETYRSSL